MRVCAFLHLYFVNDYYGRIVMYNDPGKHGLMSASRNGEIYDTPGCSRYRRLQSTTR